MKTEGEHSADTFFFHTDPQWPHSAHTQHLTQTYSLVQISEGRLNTKALLLLQLWWMCYSMSQAAWQSCSLQASHLPAPEGWKAAAIHPKAAGEATAKECVKTLCVKNVRSESLRGEEGKKWRHCNGSLFYLSVCLSARTSESINISQNAQFLLTCSPPFISGENKHGFWVLSSSAFFRAPIVFVFVVFQPAAPGSVHLVVPGTWRNSPVIMRLSLHCKINDSSPIPSQGCSLTDVWESGGVRTGGTWLDV